LIIFLAAEALFLRAHAFAAGTKMPARIPEIPQNWCFCLQSGEGWPSYYLGSSPEFSPECSKMKYTPTGKDPIGELHSCEDAGKCWQESVKDTKEKKKLEKSLCDHRKLLDGCRKPIPGLPAQALSNYEKACLQVWETIIKTDILSIEMAENKKRIALAACFARAPNRTTAKLKLRSSDREERIRAAVFLAGIDASTEPIPVLIDAVGHDETGCKAIAALGNYGPAANAAVPVLAGISTEYSNCPSSSTITLERIGTPDALAALKLLWKWERKWSLREKRLFRALSDRDPAVRGNAAWELHNTALNLNPTEEEQREARSSLHSPSSWELKLKNKKSDKLREITAALKPLLRDPQKTVRFRTASYLVDIDTTSTEAIPVLIEAVKDDKAPDFACAAIAALGGYGRAAKDAVPVLADPELIERFGYPRAPKPCSPIPVLWQIGTPDVVAALQSLRLKGLDWSAHEKQLLRAAADKDPNERADAARELCSASMESHWTKHEKIIIVLEPLLRDTDKAVRYAAASCLASIGITTKTIPVLIEAVKDPAGKYPGNAALDLARYGPAAKDAVPALARLMNEKGYSYFRLQPASEYASALEQIGTPEAIAALAPLRKKELLAGALAAPFAFLVFIPPLAPLTALFFAWLFWWSRAQHLKGRKFAYQPLLITILGWIYIAYAVTFELNKFGDYGRPFTAHICLWLSVIATLAGLIPWCVSWGLLRLRERRQAARTTVP